MGHPRTDPPDGPWGDLERPPLRAGALSAALVRSGSLWREVRVLAATGSTNAVVAEAAAAGAPEGLVVTAEAQSGGRGRLDRSWVSPPRSGVLCSVLLRPGRPMADWGWLPLLAGLAVARAVQEVAGLPARVKWPNDVCLDEAKLAGVLAEVSGGAVIVGIGLNVSTRREELPADRPATSLALAGASTTDRDTVLRGVLRALAASYRAWQVDPAPLRADYTAACSTLGRQVRLILPGVPDVVGTAEAVDELGRLVVAGTAYAAGDVIHLR